MYIIRREIREMFSSNESDNEGAISCSGAYRRPLLVAVEGNIGSGKSTFLNYCSSRNNVEVVPEPVKKWRNFNGVNLLVNGQPCNI